MIQREIEKTDIPTVGISIVRRFSEEIKPSRTVFIAWPYGHPLGEPFNIAQQRTILLDALNAVHAIKTPGDIIDMPYRWKKETYDLTKAT